MELPDIFTAKREIGKKAFMMATVKADGIDEKNRRITGWASVQELDRHGDYMLASAFEKHMPTFKKNPVMLWSHDHGLPGIGHYTDLRIVPDKGLEFEGEFDTPAFEGDLAELVWHRYKNKHLKGISVSFIPRAARKPTEEDIESFGPIDSEIIEEAELIEMSPCNVPAVANALVGASKSGSSGMSVKEYMEWMKDMKTTPDSKIKEIQETLRALQTNHEEQGKRIIAVIADLKGDKAPPPGNSAKANKGVGLGNLISDLIDNLVNDDSSRGDVIERVASAGGISASTLNQIIAGEIVCPPLERLEGFAGALGVSAGRLQTAAEGDGCDYSPPEESALSMEDLNMAKDALDNIAQPVVG